jgi:hypothetical protein
MPGWLRRLVAPLERRWIRDPAERERHDALVRERMTASAAPAELAEPADPTADAAPEAGPSGR